MLTPKFSITQNERFVTINIHCPFAKVTETEIFVEAREFKFYSSPYYLRLTLPGEVIEDDRSSAKYDSDKGDFNVTVTKVTEGEYFDGLDMITQLLAPAPSRGTTQAAIEVIDSEVNEEGYSPTEHEFGWLINQHPCEDKELSLDGPKYGFANKRHGVFTHIESEMIGLVDLPDPDTTTANERSDIRQAHEQTTFDDSHYLADLYEPGVIEDLLAYRPWWTDDSTPSKLVSLSDEDKEQMLKLPRKEYILDSTETCSAYLGLVDILLAYCYECRTTQGENTVESGWTVSKLSATLSWLQSFGDLREVLVSFCRRSVTYPLYRSWQLSHTVIADACQLFSLGRVAVLKCLLSLRDLLVDTDMRYVLNDLYITDYCVWIQSASNEHLASLSVAMKKITVSKQDANLGIERLEIAAELVVKGDKLQTGLSGLHIEKSPQCRDSDDVSTSSGDESTGSDDGNRSSDDDDEKHCDNIINEIEQIGDSEEKSSLIQKDSK